MSQQVKGLVAVSEKKENHLCRTLQALLEIVKLHIGRATNVHLTYCL